MNRKEYTKISFDCYALFLIVFLNLATAMTANDFDADMKLDLVEDQVKEKSLKSMIY